ncbi:polysaccharide lyase family 7 protein [Vibrio hippocampi]|uniref:Alginate lyase n=1 Tax=Vibrio hippocampi TaxID=654686 RepID=A0ABN8DNX3_9VIBR|nr:polysaccharide lyase family 7 protein [Vibrio hippocampi]CAH0530387.1 Alginate lyase [Vibrio hippocampi]
MKPLKVSMLATALTGALFATSAIGADYKAPTGERGVPADYAQFSQILDISKLQLSDPAGKSGNKKDVIEDGKFAGYSNEFFYVDKGSEALVFAMEGYKNRNEVRVLEHFKTGEADTYYRMTAEVMPINPRESVANSEKKRDEMTFLQIHNKGTFFDGKKGSHGEGYIPHPLLRIVYDADRSGKQDHYWAIIKNNTVNCGSKSGNKGTPECKKAYVKLDLGPIKTDEPTKFDVIAGNNKLVIKLDGVVKAEHDLTYWKDMVSYFKAGIYNQFKNGKGEAHFYSLETAVDKK